MPALANRVQETTTTGGTGTITLGGAVTGYVTFASAFATSTAVFYTIDNGAGEWEVGIGTLVTASTLSRDTVINSSNANALVNFAAGTKRVFCSAPTKALLPNQTGNSGKVLSTDGSDPNWTTTLNGMTIGNVTPGSGAFTTLSASSTVSGTGFSTYLASPPAIGGTTPAAGAFTTLSSTGNTTIGDAAGDTLTINGTAVSIPNNLNFDSNTLFIDAANNGVGVGTGSPDIYASRSTFSVNGTNGGMITLQLAGVQKLRMYAGSTLSTVGTLSGALSLLTGDASEIAFYPNGGEQARITSKGLLVGYTSDASLSSTGNAIFSGNVGIGTSSPLAKANIVSAGAALGGTAQLAIGASSNNYENTYLRIDNSGNSNFCLDQIVGGVSYNRLFIERTTGNVGIGTSSPANKLHVSGDGSASLFKVQATNTNGTASINLVPNGTGNGQIYTESGALLFSPVNTERMRLDSSGNLGLGVTPSGWNTNVKAFQFGTRGAVYTGTGGQTNVGNNVILGSGGNVYLVTAAASVYTQDSGAHAWYTAPSGTAGNAISFTQAMTLDASGHLKVGNTTWRDNSTVNSYNSGNSWCYEADAVSQAGTYYYHVMFAGTTQTGRILSTNGTNTQYLDTSDSRLKIDKGPVTETSVIDNTVVHDFVWKKTGENARGVFAQEAYEVLPAAVSKGRSDELDENGLPKDPWCVDYSKYVPDLIVYCQQLRAEIELLKAKVN